MLEDIVFVDATVVVGDQERDEWSCLLFLGLVT